MPVSASRVRARAAMARLTRKTARLATVAAVMKTSLLKRFMKAAVKVLCCAFSNGYSFGAAWSAYPRLPHSETKGVTVTAITDAAYAGAEMKPRQAMSR